MKIKCTNCKKEIDKKPSRITSNNFCSQECFHSFNKSQKRNLETLIGQKYGLLEVIKEGNGKTYNGDKKVRTWIVKCECGTEKELSTQVIKKAKSCGCLLGKPSHNWMYQPDRLDAVCKETYRNYKKGALKRNINFELEYEYFKNLIIQNCYYCGEMNANQNRFEYDIHIKVLGIDRKNNDEGYTISNSVSCCKLCNFMKRNYDENIFVEQCKKISNNYGRNK